MRVSKTTGASCRSWRQRVVNVIKKSVKSFIFISYRTHWQFFLPKLKSVA